MKTFRFDDISIETDISYAICLVEDILTIYENAEILFGISPLTYNRKGNELIDRKLLAYSDHRLFYKVKNCGLPNIPRLQEKIQLASHGLVHVDHRFLSYDAQEFSILTSCSLINTKIYIPPFNKWNKDTENICHNNTIKLIKFEDGWKCCEYNQFDKNHNLWYLHPSNIPPQEFEKWIRQI
jgi:hypothetical protein